MKILAINAYPLILPVVEIYGGAAGSLEDCRSLIVCVETENGIAGWGEATQGRPGNTYETLETMEIMTREYFGPALMGMDLEETGSVLQRLHQVRYGHPLTKAALETALLDALGKLYRVPLYRLLGSPYRGEIELVGGLGLDLGPESIRERADQLKREGFHSFKIKIGGKDRRRDIERVGAVREKVGTEATIRVDGNAAYSFAEAREILTELTRFHLADAEQPLARGDLKSLAALRRKVGIPIAAQESVSSPEDALALLEEQAADLLKIKLTHMIPKRDSGCCHHGSKRSSGGGGTGKRLHDSSLRGGDAVLKNAQPGGEMTGFLRLGEQDIFSPFQVTGGKVSLPSRPGLGIEVDKEKLARLVKRF